MLAARTGNADAVKVLLSAGAKVDAKETWNGQTALMWAAAAGHGAGRASADRSPGRYPRSFQQWRDASPVCGAARRSGGRPRVGGGGSGRQGGETRRRDAAARGGDQRARGSRGSPARQGGRPECRGRIDRADGAGRAGQADGAQIPEAHEQRARFRGRVRAAISSAGRCTPPCTSPTGTSAISSSRCKIDRLRVIKSLLAHGADVNGRISMEEPRWSGARYRRHLAGATAFLLAAKVG